MAKKNKRSGHNRSVLFNDGSAATGEYGQPNDKAIGAAVNQSQAAKQKRFWAEWGTGGRIGAIAVCLFLAMGAFGAGMKYLEDSAKRQKAAQSSGQSNNGSYLSTLNPFVPTPTPTPTRQLSKELIYSGSRLLAVEDANASSAPPADLAVWRPSTGYWHVIGAEGSQAISFAWGLSNDTPVPGDYDGDGKTDFSVFRPSTITGTGTWYISNSSNGYTIELTYGAASDKPVPADYDGDGRTDMAVFRPSNGTWYITLSSTQTSLSYQFGLSTDIPAPADYDGDGKADFAVWRESAGTFYYAPSSGGQSLGQVLSGATGSEVVSADYDGDGRADFAVKSGNSWIIHYSQANQTQTVTWGLATDEPVQNDYDGDGKVDIAVWRPSNGNWYIRQSSQIGQTGELRQEAWGTAGDIPVPAFYRR